jgi:hypothetical protein
MTVRILKHLTLSLVCAAVILVLGYCGAVWSLANFAPGGDVTFTKEQERQAAIGDCILAVFDWPSQHLLGQQRNWLFSSLFYGTILHGTMILAYKAGRRAIASKGYRALNR